MSKIIVKIAGLMAAFVLLFGFGGVAQAAENGTAGSQQDSAAVQPPSETRAVVVGGLSFVLMIGAAGAVLWYTARQRYPVE